MTKVNIDISISLDGFITGPNPRPGEGLGDGGAALHEWAFKLRSFQEQHGREGGETGRDDDVLAEGFIKAGAFLMGRSMFDLAEEPWGESPPFHAPVFVLTHEQREPLPKQGGTTFTFVSDGIESALTQARQAAGDKDVAIAGGASVIRQCLAAGVVDEMQIHVTPLLLGSGTLLFDESTAGVSLEPTRSIEGDGVTHLRYRVGDRG
jgi:dihydrofolate reductase